MKKIVDESKFVVFGFEVSGGKIKDIAIKKGDISAVIPLSIKNESIILMKSGKEIQVKNNPTEIFEKLEIIKDTDEELGWDIDECDDV
jgi:hypothetical protein